MDLPLGFLPQDDPIKDSIYVLKLNANTYGLNQGSYNWFEKLKKILMDSDFRLSEIDPHLYLRRGILVLTYVDDCVTLGDSTKAVYEFFHSMQHGPEKFVLTDEGDIDKFLGIKI